MTCPLTFPHLLLEVNLCCETLGSLLWKGTWWQQCQNLIFYSVSQKHIKDYNANCVFDVKTLKILKDFFQGHSNSDPYKKPNVCDNKGQVSCCTKSSLVNHEDVTNTAPPYNPPSCCSNIQTWYCSCSTLKHDDGPKHICDACGFCKDTILPLVPKLPKTLMHYTKPPINPNLNPPQLCLSHQVAASLHQSCWQELAFVLPLQPLPQLLTQSWLLPGWLSWPTLLFFLQWLLLCWLKWFFIQYKALVQWTEVAQP